MKSGNIHCPKYEKIFNLTLYRILSTAIQAVNKSGEIKNTRVFILTKFTHSLKLT